MSRQSRKSRRRAYKSGLWGERVAALVLILKGYRVLYFRLRTGRGEIDIVALRGKTLIFVEVKSRKGGASPEAVHPAQAARLVRAAQVFLAKHPPYCDFNIRFDVILTGGFGWPRHIKAAWQADSDSKTAIF